MFSPYGRLLAATIFTGLALISLTGCSRVAPLSEDLIRMGAAVVRDVGETRPNASLPSAELKVNLQKYLASQQWATAKATIQDARKLSRKEPVCGTTIDAVLDGKPETIESLFSKLVENTAGMNKVHSANEDAKTLSTYFTTTDPSEKQKAAFAVAVAAYKDAYCE